MMLKSNPTRRSWPAAVCLAVLMFFGGPAVPAAGGHPPLEAQDLMAVKVYNLVEVTPESPVVLLSDADEKSAMPIWISPFEAKAIYLEMGGVKPFRPQTHDLLKRVIETFRGTLRHIVITHEKENVYYAKLVIDRDGGTLEVDARPSDSLVLALKFDVPILVAKSLFALRSVPIGDASEIIRKYGLTLQELTPDLARYFSLGAVTGVLVADVRKESAAAKDGLNVRDVIVELDGAPVKDIDAIQNILSKRPSRLKAKIYRENKFVDLTLHIKEN